VQSQYFYIFYRGIYLNSNKHRMHCCISTEKRLCERATVLYIQFLSFWIANCRVSSWWDWFNPVPPRLRRWRNLWGSSNEKVGEYARWWKSIKLICEQFVQKWIRCVSIKRNLNVRNFSCLVPSWYHEPAFVSFVCYYIISVIALLFKRGNWWVFLCLYFSFLRLCFCYLSLCFLMSIFF
jgi:hypothetical protein